MSTPRPSPRSDRSAVSKALALLQAFGDEAYVGVGVSELARRADLSKSTAFRLLGVLQEDGAVERAGSRYRLGRMIQDLGESHQSDPHARLRDALTPFLAELYTLTRQTVHLAVLAGTDVVYLNKLYGHLQVRSPSRIGGRAPSYCTGVGKALLAFAPDIAERVLAEELFAWTPHTITDPQRLRAELARIRQETVGYDREEILVGLNCVAAPVMGPRNRPIAALSVSGPTGRFSPEAHATTLRQACYAAGRAVSAAFAERAPGQTPGGR